MLAKKQSFFVKIHFHENSTWQGTITWTDRNITKSFRSALEMLKLMEDSVKIDYDENEILKDR